MIFDAVTTKLFNKVLSGIIPVGKAKDADTVDGKHASDFYNKVVRSAYNNTDDPNTTELSEIRTTHANCPTSNTQYIIITTFTDSTANNYERRQTAYGTGGNNVVYNRAKQYGGSWSAWKKVANADEVLPITGGTITNGSTGISMLRDVNGVSRKVNYKVSSAGEPYIEGIREDGIDRDKYMYLRVNKIETHLGDVLHTGNSNAVKIQETAPTDTKALWVW